MKTFRWLLATHAVMAATVCYADQMEDGVHYQYDSSKGQLTISSFEADGGGAIDPIEQFETASEARWNIDRLHRNLPVVKTCTLGSHQIVFVMGKGCVAGNGFVPTVSLFTDVEIDTSWTWSAKKPLPFFGSPKPFVEARLFGGSCSPGSEAVFSNVSVLLRGSDEKEELVVQMK